MDSNMEKQANRLIKEKSPYLLQHAHNPVDWYPWSEEAFEKAKRENKPVFLSIGYSTCHWCHVMEHESFEDKEVAALLNEYFVAVKVDREERPDLDQLYMAACQILTGQGGWPLTVILTPDKKPFFAGTYFPRKAKYGINGLLELLPRFSELWRTQKGKVIEGAEELTAAIMKQSEHGIDQEPLREKVTGKNGEELLDSGYNALKKSYDPRNGGFGIAPKFPAPHQIIYLLAYSKRREGSEAEEMAINSLRAMHRGGIFDQLGYGLHRYSVDEKWLVPHFEKMLYDQALIAYAAAEAYNHKADHEMECFVRCILEYLIREMRSPDGGFYAAEDADSEGEEGTFYFWSPEEVKQLLGREAGAIVNDYFGISENGNFEKGKSVLHRPFDDREFAAARGITVSELEQLIEKARSKMLTERNSRVRPFLDDKIITSWNGLAIAALARAAAVLQDHKYLVSAEETASFILNNMKLAEGKLARRYRRGEKAIEAFLDDYANLVWGLLELYEASGKDEYLKEAVNWNSSLIALFYRDKGRFSYSSGNDTVNSLVPDAEAFDGAVPSAISVTAMNFIRLGQLTADDDLEEKGVSLVAARLGMIKNNPTAFTYLLTALCRSLSS